MGIAELVRALLLDDPSIAAVIGTRIYPQPPPQAATYPLITTHLVSNPQEPHLRQRGAGMADPRLQVDSWATTQTAMEELARHVRLRLQGFTASVVVDDSVSPVVRRRIAIRFETEEDFTETDVGGVFRRRSQDYRVQNTGIA